MAGRRQVRILVNRRSGFLWSFDSLQRAVDRYWEPTGADICYQFLQSPADTLAKTHSALAQGVDTLLVAGGDGTVSGIGAALIGAPVALGAIPVGSGNGFARHFGVSLAPDEAIRELASAHAIPIDVGVANQRPFVVTCSMAWDAAIVRTFDRMPVRGILPYIFAGAAELLEYVPRPVRIELDSGERLDIPDPIVLTIANLSQYGGGAVIAPNAEANDGLLELVVARQQDVPAFIVNIGKLLNGAVHEIPQVICRRFRSLRVIRAAPGPIQLDGELVEAPAEVSVRVHPEKLNVLVPT